MSQQLEVMDTKSSRWNVSRGIDRSQYYITVKDTISKAMSISARNSDAVIGTVILASLTNSCIEVSAGFTSVSGQTVRNLKRHDPSGLVRVNDDVVMKLRAAGTLSKKKCILAIDTHDIMYYGDPDAEGVVGTQPRKGYWAYKFGSISVFVGGERLTLAAVPVMHGESKVEHVKKLIEHALSLGVRPKILLLDGAYNSAEVINYMNSTGMKYVIRIAAPLKSIKPGDDFIYRTRGRRRREKEQTAFRLVAVNVRDRGFLVEGSVKVPHFVDVCRNCEGMPKSSQ